MLICSSTVWNFALDPIKSKLGIALLLAGSCISKNASIVAARLKADNYRFIYEVLIHVSRVAPVVWVNHSAFDLHRESKGNVAPALAVLPDEMRSTAGVDEHQ
jgi:hypothetical protein